MEETYMDDQQMKDIIYERLSSIIKEGTNADALKAAELLLTYMKVNWDWPFYGTTTGQIPAQGIKYG